MKIIGHGVEAPGTFYCCAHCARHHGHDQLKDRVETGNDGRTPTAVFSH